MRMLKLPLAAIAAVLFGASAAQSADPVRIRVSWVAPVSNWASILHGEEGPRQAPRQVLRARAGALPGHAADGHGARERRARHRQPRLFDARHRDPERRPRRHARDRRRVPRRRARPLFAGVPRARRRADQEAAGPQGQGGRHQCRRQRGRRRHARDAAQVRPRGQARLHRGRGAVPDHAGDAGGEEGRPHPGRAAVLARSGAAQDRARALHPARGDRRDAR